MEIIRLIPLFGFLLFCLQIGTHSFVLQRKGAKLSAGKMQSQKIVSMVFLMLFFLVFLNELFFKAGLIGFSVLPDALMPLLIGKSSLAISGIILILIANLLLLLSLRALNKSLRFGLDKNNLGKLVTYGIYTRSRNPFFLSVNCLFIGICLVFPTPFFIGIGVLTPLSIHLFIMKEERFMLKNYGESYKNYCEKVRRYF